MAETEARSTLGANVVFVVVSLVFACLILAAAEGALRLAGVGGPDASRTSRLKYQQIYLPVLGPSELPDGTRVLRPIDQRLPYQSVLADKPAGALRIFTFGGSATAGLGFSPNVTFARYLERMLRRAYPGRPIEVVNLGIVALSSKQVKLLVADAARRYEPDLLIVYSGNNEVLETHAEKYARAHASLWRRVLESLQATNLFRLADRAMRGPPRVPSLAEQDFSNEDLRLTQRAIVKDIEMSPEEVAAIVDGYEANLQEMADAARAAEIPLILMTVGSNWRWRGREDLPEDWLVELLGPGAEPVPETWRHAVEALSRRLETAAPKERHEWLFRRAVAAEALGDFAAAREDYRAAMNEDPHLRRALDAMNDRVRAVAARSGVALVDSIEILGSRADHGIIGFDEFYDYVHMTPRGALILSEALFREIEELGLVAEGADFDPDSYLAGELARIASLERDAISTDEWVGFGFDPGLIHDRDLWKYERMATGLDERLDADPDDAPALAYRGNVRYFELDGGAAAARDYEAALRLMPQRAELHANLERLRAEGR